MKIRIDLKWLKYFILLFFVIEPKIFTQNKIMTLIYSCANILIFIYFVLKINKNIDMPIYIWIFLRIYLFVIMIINANIQDIDQWGYLTIQVINIYFIIKNAVANKEISKFLSAGSILSIIFLGINAFTLLYFDNGLIKSTNIYDNGDGNYYFLGIKVAYTTYVLPALALAGINMKFNGKKKTFGLVLMLSLFNIFFANISTGIICIFIILITIIIQNINKFRFDIKKSVVYSLILNVLFVFCGVQSLFSNIIVNLLNKSLTLTGRTEIWEAAVRFIRNNGIFEFIFGNGIVRNGAFIPLGNDYWPAHNLWLQYIFEYGMLGTILFIIFLILLDRYKENNSFERYFLLSICLSVFVSTITMCYFGYAHIYITFIMLLFVKDFNTVEKTNKKEELYSGKFSNSMHTNL